MRKNIIQTAARKADGRKYISNDWYPNPIPSNVKLGENVFIDSSYGFAAIASVNNTALQFGDASGNYNLSSFTVGRSGTVTIGNNTILNGTNIICNKRIVIGSHCMISWGTFISDSALINPETTMMERRKILMEKAGEDDRMIAPYCGTSHEIVIEDGAWIGFDSVILPGVRLGTFCVIGCKSVISADVPPYAVVAGNPGKIIRFLKP